MVSPRLQTVFELETEMVRLAETLVCALGLFVISWCPGAGIADWVDSSRMSSDLHWNWVGGLGFADLGGQEENLHTASGHGPSMKYWCSCRM